MSFYKPKQCPVCRHKIYPIKDEDNKIIWQNLLKIDAMSILLVIGLVLMLYGFQQINKQCYDIVEHPCKYLTNLSCSFSQDLNLEEVPQIVFPENLSERIIRQDISTN